ncbi:MAG: ribosomal protein S18-alanine N-acetyltransferase [Nitrospirae bacterium]|nr:ribosomal protein S18-alanine N-acetyltransferase [Nitrospirota bacterium]
MEEIIIRKMRPDDLEQVHDLEVVCHPTPWSVTSFRFELENRDAILKVAVSEGRVIGYVCVRTILDVTHLLNIAVLPGARREGVGGMLLRNVLDELKRLKPGICLTLEVREANAAARRLYEKFGFRATGRRKRYYQEPEDDAILMERRGDPPGRPYG